MSKIIFFALALLFFVMPSAFSDDVTSKNIMTVLPAVTYYTDTTFHIIISDSQLQDINVQDQFQNTADKDISYNAEKDSGTSISKKLPRWADKLFVWHSLQKITQEELLAAIRYLMQNNIV